MSSVLTEAEMLGAWSLADELLLELEMNRSDPLMAGDLIGLATKVAAPGGTAEDVRRSAITLGVAAMRVALGERVMIGVGQSRQEDTC